MICTTKAIALKTVKYGEQKLIIHLFTRAHGRLTFVNTMGKSASSKVKRRLFQPLTLLYVTYDYRPGQALQRLRDVSLDYPLIGIHGDPYKLCVAIFTAEFSTYVTAFEQTDASLFDFMRRSVLWLERDERSISNFHLVYMLGISRFLGFFPNVSDYREGCFFDLRNGCFCVDRPLHPDYLDREESARICTIMRLRYRTMHLFKLSRVQRNRCVEMIVAFYRLHLQNLPEIRSLEVLHGVFS